MPYWFKSYGNFAARLPPGCTKCFVAQIDGTGRKIAVGAGDGTTSVLRSVVLNVLKYIVYTILDTAFLMLHARREEGYTVKYTPSPEEVPEGKARGNS